MVVKSDGETGQFLYLHRDYLGSILAVSDPEGAVLEKRHFDAWGNITHVQNGQGDDLDVLTVLDRGYTGHEHLQGVALIHMNGRLYDPLLHRFLAPDNYVQDPYNTQNFNRYGYVYNNPLSYTDPSGEIIGTVLTALFEGVKNVIGHGVNFDHYSWKQTQNAWDIDRGMVKGNFGQLLGKWTWGLLPNVLGNLVSHAHNMSGNVHEVTYSEGAVALNTTRDRGAFTLGYYINGPEGFRADWRDHLFVHEYGHALQSNILGPLYALYIVPTSLLSAAGVGGSGHGDRWFEADASQRGVRYFDKRYGTGAPGYAPGSPDYFDRNSFVNENIFSLYENPRNGGFNRGGHSIDTDTFNVFDLMPGYLWSRLLLEIF